MRRIVVLAVALTALLAPVAGWSSPRSARTLCGLNRPDTVSVVNGAEQQGPATMRRLVAIGSQCARGSMLAREILTAAQTNRPLAMALGDAVGSVLSVGDAPDGPVVPDTPGASSASPPSSATTFCNNPANLASNDRVNYDGIHMMTLTKTLGGWCWDGTYVLNVYSWGHAQWINPNYPRFCVADRQIYHGPAGTWNSNNTHSTWAHGIIAAQLGELIPINGVDACWPVTNRQYPATLRIAGNGYWDGFDDFPNPFYAQ